MNSKMDKQESIRVVIVDDEELARERISSLLQKFEKIEIVGEAGDGCTALELIEAEEPDLVFLDVQMPEMDGFEVLRQLNEKRPQVIFVTAHDKFAVQAFEVHAIDYLLKPFDRERFEIALKRAVEKIRSNQNSDANVASMLKEPKIGSKSWTRLVIKTEGRVLLLNIEDIDWIESSDNYVTLHAGSETHLMRETMNALESRLPPEKFMRISRSNIVNLERIKELQPMFHGEYIVILKDGIKLTLSRGYRNKLNSLM